MSEFLPHINELVVGPFEDLAQMEMVWERYKDLGCTMIQDSFIYDTCNMSLYTYDDEVGCGSPFGRVRTSPADFLEHYPVLPDTSTRVLTTEETDDLLNPPVAHPPIWDEFTESLRGVSLVQRDRDAKYAAEDKQMLLEAEVRGAVEGLDKKKSPNPVKG